MPDSRELKCFEQFFKDQQQLKSLFLRNGRLKGQRFDFSKFTPAIQHKNQTQMTSENKPQSNIQNQPNLNDEGPKI